jgi:GNAT superfamily N-acetyltransferase
MADLYEYVKRVRELNPDITIREADLADGEQFVALFNSYYKRKTNLAYFQWQFFNTPFESKLFTAFYDNKLVGYYGVKIYPLSGDILTGFAVDLLIHEPYRKTGIVFLLEAAIMDHCKAKGVSVMTALPNAYGNAAFRSLGWKSIAKVDTLVIDDLYSISSGTNGNSTFNNSNSVLTKFVKDDPYRNWRYNSHPIYNYEPIVLDDNNYAITKLFTDPVNGNTFGDMVEVSCSGVQNFELLLSKILVQMKAKNVHTLTTWALPHTTLYILLKELGFKAVPQERFFCVKLINSYLEKLYQINNWDLAQSDAEIF